MASAANCRVSLYGTLCGMPYGMPYGIPSFGNGQNPVSESTVSNTELSEFFGPHRVPGRELSEFLSACNLCAKTNSPSFFFLSKTVLSKQYSARFLFFAGCLPGTTCKPSLWDAILKGGSLGKRGDLFDLLGLASLR